MQKFLAQIRNIEVPDDFQDGNRSQRTKGNAIVKCLRDIKTAAEQDPVGGGGDAALNGTIIFYGISNGVRAAWELVGTVVDAENF